jgi:hypothetical protein
MSFKPATSKEEDTFPRAFLPATMAQKVADGSFQMKEDSDSRRGGTYQARMTDLSLDPEAMFSEWPPAQWWHPGSLITPATGEYSAYSSTPKLDAALSGSKATASPVSSDQQPHAAISPLRRSSRTSASR